MTNCIELQHVTHVYMPNSPFVKTSLRDVSLCVQPGEFLGIIGHTGSGKSTLIQQLNGLLRPTSGRVFINGVDIHKDKTTLRNARFTVGMVFQYPEYQLFEETVYQDIAFGPRNRNQNEDEIRLAVQEAAEAVGLPKELLDKSPFDLSGGQKRKVAIAGVLASRPEILVLDEPTAGLDPMARNALLNQLSLLHKKGMTIIIVSHSMEDVARYTNRVVLLNEGRIAYDGAPRQVFQKRAEIEKMGLSIPEASAVVQALAERGYPIDPFACTVEEATDAIAALLKGRC